MTLPSPEQLARWKFLCGEATEGPWDVWEGHAEIFAGVGRNTPGELRGRGKGQPMPCVARCDDDDELDEEQQAANAAFISSSRSALPLLLDGMEEARRVLGAVVRIPSRDCPWDCPTAGHDADCPATAARAFLGEP